MLLALSATAVAALVVGIVIVLVVHSLRQSPSPEQQPPEQPAPGSTPAPGSCKVNQPVCYYGVTYPNTCELEPLGITGYTVGACPTQAPKPTCKALTQSCVGLVPWFMRQAEKCGCPRVYQPVCGHAPEGNVLQNYGSSCVAKCEGSPSSTWKEGECPEPPPIKDCDPSDSACIASCACPATYEPVCGVPNEGEGRDYANVCLAACMGSHGLFAGSCSQYPKNRITN